MYGIYIDFTLGDYKVLNHYRNLTRDQADDLLLAWAIGSTSNSNTISIVKDKMLIGNGIGQQSRVRAARLAVSIAREGEHDIEGAVAYSDSFFPFPDGPEVLADAGVMAILTSSGSVRDKAVIDFCLSREVALVMVPHKTGRGFAWH